MIIVEPDDFSSTSSDTKKWAANVEDRGSLSPVPSHDQPPSYLDTKETLSTISSKSNLGTDHLSTIPNIKPSNFIHLNRANESIKGSWLIDPYLSIPSSFLPPPPAEGARSNLILESKNGAIDADIYLLSTSHSNPNTLKFIVIDTQSANGNVKTRLHDTKSLNGEVRLAVRLFTRSCNGSIHVQLPRSFRGPIRIKTINGSVHYSAAMQDHLTHFSELDHVRRSFMGHFNPSQWDIGVPWEGDELSIESKNGSVKILFEDESQGSHGKSSLSKFFSQLSL
jgi:hypothetical protein